MRFEKAFIPYGAYWSTPFSRWQGSFAHLHSMKFAALAVRVTIAESGNVASQVAPQLMPPGLDVTVPDPRPVTITRRSSGQAGCTSPMLTSSAALNRRK